MNKKSTKKRPKEEYDLVVKLLEEGHSVGVIVKLTGLNRNSVNTWACRFRKNNKKEQTNHICKYCGLEFPNDQSKSFASHIRWCDFNINKSQKSKKLTQEEKDQRYETKKEKLRVNRTPEETKELQRQSALASPHQRKCKKTTQYTQVDGNIVNLDSNWEVLLAKRLDNLSVNWIRPSPLPWVDKDGITHNYFADFYLPNYDLFIDPKNKFVMSEQKEKIDILLDTYKNIIFLNTEKECMEYCPKDVVEDENKEVLYKIEKRKYGRNDKDLCSCGQPKYKKSNFCVDCDSLKRQKFNPSKEELQENISKYSFTKLAKLYNVSDVAVKKRCERLGVDLSKTKIRQKPRNK